MSDTSSEPSGPPSPGRPSGSPPHDLPPLAWPPPGLERIQGDLWRVIRGAGLGSVIFAVPLLWSVGTDQPFWSFGPFGTSWWIVAVTSLLGLAILGDALVNLFRLLQRGARATREGYGWVAMLAVAADDSRDTGFLLQGARAYSTLEGDERRRMILARLGAGVLYLAAVLWVPVALVACILLGSRGVGSPAGIWLATLGPAALLLAAGGVARLVESRMGRRARAAWFRQPWTDDLRTERVEGWMEGARTQAAEETLDPGEPGSGIAFRLGASAVVFIGLLVAVPTLSLITAGVISPVLASIAVPRYGATQERAARAAVLRRFRLPGDTTVSAGAAGDALHSLTTLPSAAGGEEELILPPPRSYPEPLFSDPDEAAGPLGIPPALWARELLPRAARGLGPDGVAYLRRVAAHPSHREIETLARAPALDAAGSRWPVPFPGHLSLATLPIPETTGFRSAAYAHVGRAALELHEGRVADAERTVREVISAGLLVGFEAPTLVENLIGLVVAQVGGDALHALYVAAGRDADADALLWARESVERAVKTTRVSARNRGLAESLQDAARAVTDPTTVRGLRWEYLMNVASFAPCLNLNRIVFGPDESYREWLAAARRSLARYPAEEELFRLAVRGWLAPPPDLEGGGIGVLGRILTLALGGGDTPGTCAATMSGAPGVVR